MKRAGLPRYTWLVPVLALLLSGAVAFFGIGGLLGGFAWRARRH